MQPCQEPRAVIARAVQGLTELEAVLCLEVTPREVRRPGEGHESHLTLLIEHANGLAQSRRERPVRIEGERAGAR